MKELLLLAGLCSPIGVHACRGVSISQETYEQRQSSELLQAILNFGEEGLRDGLCKDNLAACWRCIVLNTTGSARGYLIGHILVEFGATALVKLAIHCTYRFR